MTNLTIVAANTKNVQVVQQKTTISIFSNAAFSGQGSAQTRIKVPFSFGDATPKFVGNFQGLIKNASLIITTPFNSPSMLALGDDLNSGRLINQFANNPMLIAEYEFSPIVEYLSITAVKLTITPGIGCTSGSGFVILEV